MTPASLTPLPADADRAAAHANDLFAAAEQANVPLADALRDGWLPADALPGILDGSPYLRGLILRDPARFAALVATDPPTSLDQAAVTLRDAMATAETEAEAMAALRRYKQVLALVTALADLADLVELATFTEALSEGAELTLEAALRWTLHRNHPDIEPAACGLVFIGMGKLGGRELNYSSDIDVIALFEPMTLALPEGKEAQPYAVKIVQTVVKLMQDRTADGYVFRTDLRLRPDPGATPVAVSINAALTYYEALGQNWERAAMIKARPVAGDQRLGNRFLREMQPFIWRRHLDYAAIADIHAMKRQIHAAKGHGAIAVAGHNIKLGRGGIREIEFFVQTQQLIAAGRNPDLRSRQTVKTLRRLTDAGWIAGDVRDDLTAAYRALRSFEHRLQMQRDEQIHTIPASEETLHGFAKFCGFDSAASFSDTLGTVLTTVQEHYRKLFEAEPALSSECGSLVFTGVEPDPETISTLESFGFSAPDQVWQTIHGWHMGRVPATRTARAREMLTALMPDLLHMLQATGTPDAAFIAFDRFLGQLPAGIQLFSMLNAKRHLLELLGVIVGTAPRLSAALVRRPALLDAVLDPRFLGDLPSRSIVTEALDDALADVGSYEEALDAARVVGQDQAFLIGIRQISGNLGARQAGRAYAILAEVLIGRLFTLAWEHLRHEHGMVAGGAAVVLGMGKLGGRELTAGSDLDLILIYDHDPDAIQSDGRRPVAVSQYFARLTQRLIAAISAPTARGTLYEVDMRLRPSGRSGPVATRIESFETYQKNEAWTWEHMALTRARPVAGSTALSGRIETLIADVLTTPRDPETTAADIRDMRDRLLTEKRPEGHWDLKLAKGGLVDLEFIAQGGQLIAGIGPIHNTRDALEALGDSDVLPMGSAADLVAAYDLYEAVSQRLRLCIEGSFDPDTAPDGLRAQLAGAAGLPDFTTLDATLKDTQALVGAQFDHCFRAPASALAHQGGEP